MPCAKQKKPKVLVACEACSKVQTNRHRQQPPPGRPAEPLYCGCTGCGHPSGRYA